jgi:hypothetical protein
MEQIQEAADSTEQDYKQLRAQLDKLAEAKWKLEAREAEVRGERRAPKRWGPGPGAGWQARGVWADGAVWPIVWQAVSCTGSMQGSCRRGGGGSVAFACALKRRAAGGARARVRLRL